MGRLSVTIANSALCAVLACACCAAQSGPPPNSTQNPPARNAEPNASPSGNRNREVVEVVPEPPKVPDVLMPGERGGSLGFTGWFANPKPQFRKGSFQSPYSGNLDFPGKPSYNYGGELGVAAGSHNIVQISFFRSSATGATAAPTDLGLISQFYAKGDYLATDYRITGVKVALNYLTWPYPVKNSRFRLKTVWALQYLGFSAGFDAPFLATTDQTGAPIITSTGEALTYATRKTYRFYLPQLGLKTQYYVKPGLRLEAGFAGLAIPHHQNSWDAEASANMRVSHYELRLGFRAYHFRTSPQRDFWARGTMAGPFVGLRFYTDKGPR